MESARRWSGFVCPDCRFVFRVPRDHDGLGVVCPSCRRMLKIPTSSDKTPPLLVPLKGAVPEEHVDGHGHKKRRMKKPRHSQSHAWDSDAGKARSSDREEKRQMFWMLLGGSTLFALIVAGVLMALLGGDKPVARTPVPAAAQAVSKTAIHAAAQKSDAAFLAEAEPLTKKFLDAACIEDLVPLVRNPKLAEARMRRHYPDGKITPAGMSAFNTLSEISRYGQAISLNIRTGDFDEKAIAFFETPSGIKIDWESWVGWSEMPWEEFLATKPTQAKLFRLNLSPINYYNIGFADDRKWKSYRLISPDEKHAIYGYAEIGSVVNASLRSSLGNKPVCMILALRFPENAASANQVIIDKRIAEGWVLENEESP